MNIIAEILIGLSIFILGLFAREIFDKWKERLSSMERRLLISAAENEGYLQKEHTDQSVVFIMIGSNPYINNFKEQTEAVEALDKLVNRQYAFHQGGASYRLTGSGFDVAKKLGAKMDFWKSEPGVNPK